MTRVRGIEIEVNEETIARVTGLVTQGEHWINRRNPINSLRDEFVRGTNEQI